MVLSPSFGSLLNGLSLITATTLRTSARLESFNQTFLDVAYGDPYVSEGSYAPYLYCKLYIVFFFFLILKIVFLPFR